MTEPATNLQRDPDLSENANKYAPSNGLSFEDGIAHLRGYQEFTVDGDLRQLTPIGPGLIAKEHAVARAFTRRFMARRTVLDLGGNNGYFAFRALAAGATAATVVDIDPECILNLDRVRSRFVGLPLEAHQKNCDAWDRPADVVLAFALVHWIYSCTSRALSLERLVGSLAALTRDFLLVEWVDPSDPLVKGYRHTEVAENDVAEPYEFTAFRQALEQHFSRIDLVGEITPARRIYLASRDIVADLSWSAPLRFPKETLLTSQRLWTASDAEFWSRVHRESSQLYRQCSPELARREIVGAAAIGTEVEVIEQHDDWWMLRAPFIEGETLDRHVAATPVTREQRLRIVVDLLDAVERLQRAGITHRDLHPGNVIIQPEGHARLIDFGWAQLPGFQDITPAQLGTQVELPATQTWITVRPPEGGGDDLFAIGQIAAWMCRDDDREVAFLARWLGHPDYRRRLKDLAVARELATLLLQTANTALSPFARASARAHDAIASLARHSVGDTLRLVETTERLSADLAGLQRERDRTVEQLRAAEDRVRELEEKTARHTADVQRYIRALEESMSKRAALARAPAPDASTPTPAPAQPVSIVIPLRDGAERTERCLEAIVQHTSGDLFEIVLVDDGSTDVTPQLLGALTGDVKTVRNDMPRGLVDAGNQGAAMASGKYLVFLQNDLLPEARWLSSLLEIANADPGVGIVIPRIATFIDRAPEQAPASAILVRADLFKRLGGLEASNTFSEAVADLCSRARACGVEVRSCPASVVVQSAPAVAA